ncbi:hypothetical protein BC834DRAFT_300689 [Gloeopeniophorella convolvens]|nr:hypothetical protein BC834DRAFT_300689 [Gloeopeniophorella convolvens]
MEGASKMEKSTRYLLEVRDQEYQGAYLSIDTLHDDILLEVFDHCRSLAANAWNRSLIWFTLIHVCRRWRRAILNSPNRFCLELLCKSHDPPVEQFVQFSSLPLRINHRLYEDSATNEGRSSNLLALRYRHRVRSLTISTSLLNVHRILEDVDGPWPALRTLTVHAVDDCLSNWSLELYASKWFMETTFPSAFSAPHLQSLSLKDIVLPSYWPPMLPGASSTILDLTLGDADVAGHVVPERLVAMLSSMPRLETLRITLLDADWDAEEEGPARTLLPQLTSFYFKGDSIYFDDLMSRINAPSLKTMRTLFTYDFPFTLPRISHFVGASKNFQGCSAARVVLGNKWVRVQLGLGKEVGWLFDEHRDRLNLEVEAGRLDWKIASAAVVLGELAPLLHSVEILEMRHRVGWAPPVAPWKAQGERGVYLTDWVPLLRRFKNVKKLLACGQLAPIMFDTLLVGNAERGWLNFLPELRVIYIESGLVDGEEELMGFIDARQREGRPVSVVRV